MVKWVLTGLPGRKGQEGRRHGHDSALFSHHYDVMALWHWRTVGKMLGTGEIFSVL